MSNPEKCLMSKKKLKDRKLAKRKSKVARRIAARRNKIREEAKLQKELDALQREAEKMKNDAD